MGRSRIIRGGTLFYKGHTRDRMSLEWFYREISPRRGKASQSAQKWFVNMLTGIQARVHLQNHLWTQLMTLKPPHLWEAETRGDDFLERLADPLSDRHFVYFKI